MEPENLFRNLFAKGLDVDTDVKLMSNEKYRGASHIKITGDGSLMGIQALKGTTKAATMLAGPMIHSEVNIMGAVRARCYFQSSNVVDDGIIIFWATGSTGVYYFNISVFRPSTGSINAIYTESVDSGIMSRAVDVVVVRDGMVDSLYFTDGFYYPRKLKAIIRTTQLGERDIDLFRRYPQSGISVDQILYNPKEQSFLTGLHRIRFVSTLSDMQTNSWTEYASLLFDAANGSSSIGIANTFRVVLDLIVQQSIENDGSSSSCTATASVLDRNGTILQSLNNTLTSSLPGGNMYQNYYQRFENITIDVPTGVSDYDAAPIKVQTFVSTFGDADVFTQISVALKSITPLGADVDSYILGANTNIFLYLPIN